MADVPTRGGVAGQYVQAYTFGSGTFGAMTSYNGQSSANWFGPGAPMADVVPSDVAGRVFDFPTGYNLVTTARAYSPVTFRDLRELADGYDLLSLVIETRKDQVARMSWSIASRNPKARDDSDPRVQRVTAFFQRPDGQNNWNEWLRSLLDDLLVYDAPALYKRRDNGGNLVELIQLDGATIKPVIDPWGRRPVPITIGGATYYPVAYQQILKGLPLDYSTRDLIYKPRNVRAHSAYGRSPVEQVMTTVNIALRRQLSTLEYFSSGNIPDAIIQVPKEWNPDQIVAFQRHWDQMLAGDLAMRRRVKFIPGMGGSAAVHETRQIDLKQDFDEWLMLIVCFAFSVSPQALRKMMNRASAETQKDLAQEEGLEPLLLWIKALIDDVIAEEFGCPDLEFVWSEDDEEATLIANVSSLVKLGLATLNEGRQRLGMDPLSDPAASRPLVLTPNGYVPIGAAPQAANTNLKAD